MDVGLTSQENIALDLIFARILRQSRRNRSMLGYMKAAARAPAQKIMVYEVKRALHEMAEAGFAPYEICYFKAGDRKIEYHPFPTSLSRETVRQAWVKSGMRELQLLFRRHKAKRKRRH